MRKFSVATQFVKFCKYVFILYWHLSLSCYVPFKNLIFKDNWNVGYTLSCIFYQQYINFEIFQDKHLIGPLTSEILSFYLYIHILIFTYITYKNTPKKRGILNMTINHIWCWGSNSGALRSVEYSFIAWSTLTQTDSTGLSPIYRSNRSFWKLFIFSMNTGYHITVCKLFVLIIVTWSYNCLLRVILLLIIIIIICYITVCK